MGFAALYPPQMGFAALYPSYGLVDVRMGFASLYPSYEEQRTRNAGPCRERRADYMMATDRVKCAVCPLSLALPIR